MPKSLIEKCGGYLKQRFDSHRRAMEGRVIAGIDTVINWIDLSHVLTTNGKNAVEILIAIAYLSSQKTTGRLETSIETLARAASLFDLFQFDFAIYYPFLEKSISSFSEAFYFIEAFADYIYTLPMSRAFAVSMSGVKVILQGKSLLRIPLCLRGYQCKVCVDDRDDLGFCRTCKLAVYCVLCFLKGIDARLDEQYKCIKCNAIQACDIQSALKFQGLDWSIDFFRVFIPALYLYQAHGRQQFVDMFQLKRDTEFNLEAVPKMLSDYKLPIVQALLPYIKMLVAA